MCCGCCRHRRHPGEMGTGGGATNALSQTPPPPQQQRHIRHILPSQSSVRERAGPASLLPPCAEEGLREHRASHQRRDGQGHPQGIHTGYRVQGTAAASLLPSLTLPCRGRLIGHNRSSNCTQDHIPSAVFTFRVVVAWVLPVALEIVLISFVICNRCRAQRHIPYCCL